jgi:hypothetical protein
MVVDPDAVLSLPIAGKSLEPVFLAVQKNRVALQRC